MRQRPAARAALFLLALLTMLLVALLRSQGAPPLPGASAPHARTADSRIQGGAAHEPQPPAREEHQRVSSRRPQLHVGLQPEAESSSSPTSMRLDPAEPGPLVRPSAPALPPDVQTAIPEEEVHSKAGGGPAASGAAPPSC